MSEIPFFKNLFNDGDLVYDVGANEGSWTQMMLENGAGRVVAFEPQPKLAEKLNVRFSGKPVVVVRVALGEKDGEAQMMMCADASLATLSTTLPRTRFRIYNWRRGIRTSITTLDKVISVYGVPRFIKIDVEGYEENVISGLSKEINSIGFEYTAETMNETLNCVNRLSGIGNYEYRYTLGDYPSFRDDIPWRDGDTTVKEILAYQSAEIWGNIYARLRS